MSTKAWRDANQDKIIAYRVENSERIKLKQKEYRERNREKRMAQSKQWREDNKGKAIDSKKKWNIENSEHVKAYTKKHKADNRAAYTSYQMDRKASKLKRTPSWANKDSIKNMYRLAKMLEAMCFTPTKYHVDHYYPLQGKKVSGLHCESNLRVVTAFENQTKINNMPTECGCISVP